ncbi:hypothetical protein [Paludisphaera rhizosphaerae]|uniref:hypothetical protein n=1 Tax=Paludisphaera rhizosphaerae TaxID=2711216 RepID=UPI0013EA4970|nr:hypothetical protein [Paludisphaera rhizosphaerae]
MSIAETVMTANGARTLIDARLDAIDRALLGRVSRAERLDVVGEVESRIGELLHARCGSSEPSREDVLAVLAQLDPPEAYLGDDEEGFERPRGVVGGRPGGLGVGLSREGSSPGHGREWYGWVSGITGGISLLLAFMMPVVYLLAVAAESELVLFGGWAMVGLMWLAAATTTVVLAAVSRMTGGWSVVGLTLAIVSGIPVLSTPFLLFMG